MLHEGENAMQAQAHAALGPSCAVADVRADRAVIWCSTRGVYPLRESLAHLLQLSPEQTQVIYAEGAGSYGRSGSDDAAADAAVPRVSEFRPTLLTSDRLHIAAGCSDHPAKLTRYLLRA